MGTKQTSLNLDLLSVSLKALVCQASLQRQLRPHLLNKLHYLDTSMANLQRAASTIQVSLVCCIILITLDLIVHLLYISAQYTHSHKVAVKRIGKYLKGTMDKGLILDPSAGLTIDCYPDEEFARL